MGEPDSMTTEDVMRQLALGALGPRGAVSARTLRETGLHREFLQVHFNSLETEFKYLVGWKELREFKYVPDYRADSRERQRGETLTEAWLKLLDEHGIAGEYAIQIFDGELRPMPAPDYRLFLLRDGRLLYYAGGFHGWRMGGFALGGVLKILDTLDRSYSESSCAGTPARQPFLIIMNARADALDRAIKDRESKVRKQRALEERLRQVIKQVSTTT